MILSMAIPLDILEKWLDKVKVFHSHKLRIDDLQSGNHPYTFHSHQNSSSHLPCDPNTMEVDFVKLKKLTLQKCAKYMREGCCFKCRKVSHDARSCRFSGQPQQNLNSPQTSQQVHHTEDVPIPPTPVEKTTVSAFFAYIHFLEK